MSYKFWMSTIGSAVGAFLAILLFGSCTIAPKVTQPDKPSAWAQENVIGYDATGLIVGADWVRTYHGLLKAYGNKLPINEQVPADDSTGITPKGDKFHVSWDVNTRFTDLKRLESQATP